MKTATNKWLNVLAVITLIISLSIQEATGQSLLKKLKNAANKELNKVVPPSKPATTPTTENNQQNPTETPAATQTHENKINNTNVASVTIPPVVEIPKEIHLVPNPDGNDYNFNNPIIYKNKLYFQISSSTGSNQLAEYDGTKVRAIFSSNSPIEPDSSLDMLSRIIKTDRHELVSSDIKFNDLPITYNNKLYIFSGSKLFQFDGSNLTPIPIPKHWIKCHEPFVFKNKLYFTIEYIKDITLSEERVDERTHKIIPKRIVQVAVNELEQYDGKDTALISACLLLYKFMAFYNSNLYIYDLKSFSIFQFDGTTFSSLQDHFKIGESEIMYVQSQPIVYKNKLYFSCTHQSLLNPNEVKVQLANYDGKKIEFIANPNKDVYPGAPAFIINDKLYCQNEAKSGSNELLQFDGTNFIVIPNPGIKAKFTGYPISYNNKLFLSYNNRLAEYDGNAIKYITNSADELSNNNFREIFYSDPIVYKNKLYFKFWKQLAWYNGTELNIIKDAAGQYGGYPIVYNNRLYFIYKNQLAYLDEGN